MNTNDNTNNGEKATVPLYPGKIQLSCELSKEMHPFMKELNDGISEFTFPSIFLHRDKYHYELSKHPNGFYLLFGTQHGRDFFSVLGPIVGPALESGTESQSENEALILSLLDSGYYWKNMSKSQKDSLSDRFVSSLEQNKYTIIDDRDNADYIYKREDLANLVGKTYHKKRNQINSFEQSYTHRVERLSEDNLKDAFYILDEWQKNTTDTFTDYDQCVEALKSLQLDNIKSCMALEGIIVYADDKPAGWTLGEKISQGTTFIVHFEKGIIHFKGVYQYITREMARALSESVIYMNREQDLGDEGLRQAKMTWRPNGFISKYKIIKSN